MKETEAGRSDKARCRHCGKELASELTYQKHMVRHIPDQERPFKCEHCYKGFATKSELQSHNDRIHQPKDESLASICDLCGKKLANPATLISHKKYVHEKVRHAMCHICPKTFTNRRALKEHLYTHGEINEKIQCDVCEKWLKNHTTLRSHMQCHSNKLFSCPHCDKVYNMLKSLRFHLQTHSDVRPHKCLVCGKTFKQVEKFKYLGATVKNINDTWEEIKNRINMGNACYYSVEKLLSSSLLSKNLKVRIYKTVILPVVLYGCETWTLTLREEHRLRMFENKVLRKIFGAKRHEVTGEWRKLHNTELHALYFSRDIIRNIKSRRLRWAGHVARMGESINAYRVLVGRPERKRPLGRPRRRWKDNIKMDLREVGYDDREWINLAQVRGLCEGSNEPLGSLKASKEHNGEFRICSLCKWLAKQSWAVSSLKAATAVFRGACGITSGFKIRTHVVQHTGEKPYQCPHCLRTFASSGNYYSHKKRMHSKEREIKLREMSSL
ncbi:hypothetical protein ANN_08626 [Periplaneta americana]|uniref:C2H2-type domain-containing protein n=1 Tax=Periplaneta americana TaxID=6978 RepID=A0ABQ8T1X3_PERAM|nr:hypothetical protein ANN_08626 [Periplaneta americana]